MTTWQYYLSGDTPEQADEGRAGLIRVPVGAAVSLAEQLGRSGDWSLTDRLWRQKYLGSWNETTEIEQERAQQLMHRWVEIGRVEKLPSDESTTPPEIIAELTEMDSRAAAIWHDVPTPPGAKDIAMELTTCVERSPQPSLAVVTPSTGLHSPAARPHPALRPRR